MRQYQNQHLDTLEKQEQQIKQEFVNYQLINQQKLNICLTLTMNEEETILIACTTKGLKIFNFNKGNIVLRQKMDWLKNIQDAQFLNKNNEFIILFSYGRCLNYILDHNQMFQCQGEIMRIAGVLIVEINRSFNSIMFICYQKIEFWKKEGEWYQNQIVKVKAKDAQISQKENLLVICLRNKNLQILEQNSLNQWVKSQNIILQIQAQQICIISDETIAVRTNDSIELFQKNSKTKLFQITSYSLKLKNLTCIHYFFKGFKFIFNQILSAIIFEHDGLMQIYKYIKDQRFQQDFLMNFKSRDVKGIITQNGKYFISWDDNSRQLKAHVNVI